MTGKEIAELEELHGIRRGQTFYLEESGALDELARRKKEYEVVMLYPHTVEARQTRRPHLTRCFDYWTMNVILGRGNPDCKAKIDKVS